MLGRTRNPTVMVVSGVLRAGFLAALGGLYLWMGRTIQGNGGRPVDWLSPAFVSSIFFIGAVIIIARTFLKARAMAAAPPAPRNGGPGVDPEPAFDADAALQRYLANRVAAAEPSPAEAPKPPTQARPAFGRKRPGA